MSNIADNAELLAIVWIRMDGNFTKALSSHTPDDAVPPTSAGA